ncbi:DUF397 domain-containing protein [Nocardia violaceofusca]|uniref:DUF397 domain-containing protein n=1 Tax=Nocardia violaceofusca TaxID=941182 RepID=UPI000A004511|nr:DUF397 domain-containing protein [Nocardia violaceofusca]
MNIDPSRTRSFKSPASVATKDRVEVVFLEGGRVGIRDSKNPDGPALIFASAEWTPSRSPRGSPCGPPRADFRPHSPERDAS